VSGSSEDTTPIPSQVFVLDAVFSAVALSAFHLGDIVTPYYISQIMVSFRRKNEDFSTKTIEKASNLLSSKIRVMPLGNPCLSRSGLARNKV